MVEAVLFCKITLAVLLESRAGPEIFEARARVEPPEENCVCLSTGQPDRQPEYSVDVYSPLGIWA